MEHGEMEREMRKGRYCLVAGAAAAGGGAGGRLTTAAQPRSGGKLNAETGGGPGTSISPPPSPPPPPWLRGSCSRMKNGAALIRLHYRTSDYARLTLVQGREKKDGGKGNTRDLINYAIMWNLLWL